jgi:hypothetical protein
MIENKIFNYFDVWNIVKDYINKGELPFDL